LGTFATTRGLGYVTGSFFGGIALEKRPGWGNICIEVGLSIMMLSNLMITIHVESILYVCFCLLLTGLCCGMLDVGANVLMIKEFDIVEESEPYIQTLHASFAVGGALAPSFVTALSSEEWFSLPFYIISGLFVPLLVGGFFICRLPPRTISEQNAQKYEGYNISTKLKIVLVALFSFTMFLYVGSEISIGYYVFTVATQTDFEPLSAGFLNTAFWSAFALLRIASIFMSAFKFSSKWMVVGSVLGTCLFSILPLISDVPAVLWVACIGIGLSMAPTFPSIYNYAGSLFEVSGRISASFVISSAIGEMMIPFVIGLLFKTSLGYSALFLTVAGASFLGLVAILTAGFLLRNVQKQSTEHRLVLSSDVDEPSLYDDNDFNDL
jgi:FHS family Na+ dependent glucose MFS transporter 1